MYLAEWSEGRRHVSMSHRERQSKGTLVDVRIRELVRRVGSRKERSEHLFVGRPCTSHRDVRRSPLTATIEEGLTK